MTARSLIDQLGFEQTGQGNQGGQSKAAQVRQTDLTSVQLKQFGYSVGEPTATTDLDSLARLCLLFPANKLKKYFYSTNEAEKALFEADHKALKQKSEVAANVAKILKQVKEEN
mgnify:CR=1 FL=1